MTVPKNLIQTAQPQDLDNFFSLEVSDLGAVKAKNTDPKKNSVTATSEDISPIVTFNMNSNRNYVDRNINENQSLLVSADNLGKPFTAKDDLRLNLNATDSVMQDEKVKKLTTPTKDKPVDPIKFDLPENVTVDLSGNEAALDYLANNDLSQNQVNANAKQISSSGIGSSVQANTPQYQVDPMSRAAYQEMLENSQSGNLFRAENVGVPQQADKKKFIAITQNKKGLAKLELVNRRTKAPLQNFQSGLFILTNTNENIAARKEIVMTQDIDVINFFGKDVFIWTYSGITLNGDVSTQDRDTTLNWYDEFTKFSMLALGQPIYQRNPHYLKFTYLNYVRYGYLLEVNYSTNSQNPALVSVNFSVAIDNFFNTETT